MEDKQSVIQQSNQREVNELLDKIHCKVELNSSALPTVISIMNSIELLHDAVQSMKGYPYGNSNTDRAGRN